MTDKLREAALWKLLTEAREALWQPANPDLCGRIDEALAQQDAQNAADEVWRKLFWQAALKLKCLPSSYPDANGHVLRAIDRLMGSENAQQDAQAVPQGWVWDCCIHSKGGWKVIAHFDVPIKVGTRLNAAPTPPAQEKQS